MPGFTQRWGYDYGDVEHLHTSRSGKARLFRDTETGEKFWVPVSQIHPGSEVSTHYHGILIVMPWFAQKMGWIDTYRYNIRGVPQD